MCTDHSLSFILYLSLSSFTFYSFLVIIIVWKFNSLIHFHCLHLTFACIHFSHIPDAFHGFPSHSRCVPCISIAFPLHSRPDITFSSHFTSEILGTAQDKLEYLGLSKPTPTEFLGLNRITPADLLLSLSLLQSYGWQWDLASAYVLCSA